MQMSQFKTAPDAVRLIIRKEGIKGLYAVCIFEFILYHFPMFMFCSPMLTLATFDFQGYGSFLLRDLPFDAIQFCIYEQLRIGYKLAVFISFCRRKPLLILM